MLTLCGGWSQASPSCSQACLGQGKSRQRKKVAGKRERLVQTDLESRGVHIRRLGDVVEKVRRLEGAFPDLALPQAKTKSPAWERVAVGPDRVGAETRRVAEAVLGTPGARGLCRGEVEPSFDAEEPREQARWSATQLSEVYE